MASHHFKQEALDDLTGILRWLGESASHKIAQRFLEAVELTAANVSNFPGIGRSSESYGMAELRHLSVKGFQNHLLFYRVHAGGIEVVRLLHGARDVPTLFDEREE